MSKKVEVFVMSFGERRFSVRGQLMASFGVTIVLFFVALGYAVYCYDGLSVITNRLITHSFVRSTAVDQSNISYNRAISNVRGYLSYGDEFYLTEYRKDMDRAIAQIKIFNDENNPKLDAKVIADYGFLIAKLLGEQSSIIDGEIVDKKAKNPIWIDKSEQAKQKTVEIEKAFGSLQELQFNGVQGKGKAIVKESDENKQMIYLYVVVLLVILLGGVFFFSRYFMKRINKLNHELIAVGQLDLTGKTDEVYFNDEIGDMGRIVGAMREQLREVLLVISTSSQTLSSSSFELSAITSQSTQAAHQVSDSITEIARGTEKQAASSEHMVNISNEISKGTQEVSNTTMEVSVIARNASDKATQGRVVLDQAIANMVAISGETKAIQVAIAELSEGSKEINEIVNLISTISNQTNLLALNAAIEAARAGENGRGFAVVAEEVRKLAEESNKAAQRIGKVIQKNELNMGHAVQVTQTSAQSLQTGITTVRSAGDAFNDIVETVIGLSKQINTLSVGVERMASNGETLLTYSFEVNGISKENAMESQSISASTEEQTASMEEIANFSRNLAGLIKDLEMVVERFRIVG